MPSTVSTGTLTKLSSFLAIALATAGCGIGYGQKVQSATIGRYDGDFNIDGDPGYDGTTKFSTTNHTLTLYDTSGLLLSVAGSAGSAVTAKNEAEHEVVDVELPGCAASAPPPRSAALGPAGSRGAECHTFCRPRSRLEAPTRSRTIGACASVVPSCAAR